MYILDYFLFLCRVQHREGLLATKQQQLALAAREKEEEERKKEDRLESIRAQVNA